MTTTTNTTTFSTRNRRLENFLFLHGVDFLDFSKDEDGMTVWTYRNSDEVKHIVGEFKEAQQRRERRGF